MPGRTAVPSLSQMVGRHDPDGAMKVDRTVVQCTCHLEPAESERDPPAPTTVAQAIAAGRVKIDGNRARLDEPLTLLDNFDPLFNIVTL